MNYDYSDMRVGIQPLASYVQKSLRHSRGEDSHKHTQNRNSARRAWKLWCACLVCV